MTLGRAEAQAFEYRSPPASRSVCLVLGAWSLATALKASTARDIDGSTLSSPLPFPHPAISPRFFRFCLLAFSPTRFGPLPTHGTNHLFHRAAPRRAAPNHAASQLVVASPPKANSQAEKLGVKKGDLVSSINGLNAVNMDSFEVTDYLAKYQVPQAGLGPRGPARCRFLFASGRPGSRVSLCCSLFLLCAVKAVGFLLLWGG